ncbi:MAG: hypothetical protein ACI9DF_005728 [Verrucomicrobiales bacterium]|jgi:hypothetical protein
MAEVTVSQLLHTVEEALVDLKRGWQRCQDAEVPVKIKFHEFSITV